MWTVYYKVVSLSACIKTAYFRLVRALFLTFRVGVPSPPHFFTPLNTLLPLTTKMQKLIHPAEATPKTQTIVQPIFDQAMSTFADLRGDWLRRTLGAMVNKVEEVDEGGIWEGGRGKEKVRGLVGLWEVMVIMLEVRLLLPKELH